MDSNKTKQQPQAMEVTVLEALETIPAPVKEYLLSDEVGALRVSVWEAAKLSEAEKDAAIFTELSVFFKTLELAKFPDTLFNVLGWDDSQEERVAQLAADIMGKVMFPADAWIGDVAGAIQDIGFDPAAYPHTKIRLGVRTYDEASKLAWEQSGVADPTGEVMNRALKVIESHLRGVRVDSDTLGALSKARKVGGVGLTDDEAMSILAATKVVMEGNLLMDDVPVAEHGPEESHGTAPADIEPKVWDKAAITAAYAGSKEEQAAIAAAREALRADGDKNVLAKFAAEVVADDKEESDSRMVVAGVLMMSEAGVLMKTAKEPALRAAFRTYLGDIEAGESIGQLDQDPENPALFSHYLAFLLKVKASLSDSDAARFALKASNAMKKAGVKDLTLNVAFHPETGEFVWDLSA